MILRKPSQRNCAARVVTTYREEFRCGPEGSLAIELLRCVRLIGQSNISCCPLKPAAESLVLDVERRK